MNTVICACGHAPEDHSLCGCNALTAVGESHDKVEHCSCDHFTHDIFGAPRFPDGPLICLKENLPAFETWKKADAFHEANSPGSRYVRQWQCRFCGCWHYLAKPRAPSGDSSGSSRR